MQFPPDDETQPLILGRYHRQATLDIVVLGEVVRAVDVHLGRLVAIKTLHPDLSSLDRECFLALETGFHLEAEVAVRMGVHPNVVTIYGLDRDALGNCYLIMEYISGDTLRERLAHGGRQPLPLTEALQITGDVARGLHAAHMHRIVHCDVKPANIFLAAEGQAKVRDFSIAQVDEHTIVWAYPHALLYASPEQMVVTSLLGPASDQYSLGLVLFEMLTGVAYRPLRAQEAQERLAAFPPPVRALIARMVAVHPGTAIPQWTRW